MKKLLIILLLLLAMSPDSLAQQTSADQEVCGELGECITIDNTVVNGVILPCGGTTTVDIETVTPISPTINQLSLTPVQVNVVTNNTNGFIVDADFVSLSNATFTFPVADISVAPASITEPIAIQGSNIVGDFIPQVLVDTTTPTGTYNGLLTFTVTSL